MTTTTVTPTMFTRIVPRPYAACRTALAAAFPGLALVDGHETTRLVLDLRTGRGRRQVPVRLELAPWTTDGATSGLELVPMRAVRPTPGYFRAGHRLLDAVVARLVADRRPAGHGPGQTESRSVHSAA